MKILLAIIVMVLFNRTSFSQELLQHNVEAVLKQTKNRKELEKVIAYFSKTDDPLLLKSAYFLIINMPIHSTHNYYWADKSGRKVPYNELAYPTFNAAVQAIEKLKIANPGLHPVSYTYKDIDSIKADFLIHNIELAVSKYRSQKRSISESDFFEYLLPYRVSTEPLQDWRKTYAQQFVAQFSTSHTTESNLIILKKTLTSKFTNLWGVENKTEPLSRLGAMQILLRQKGMCEDLASMVTFVARSQGIPATVDNIPGWATSTGAHFLNFLKLDSGHTHFDAVLDSLGREPAKVLRTTYSAHPDAIATWRDSASIPNNFLRIKNYKDVTNEYWQTADIDCPLFSFERDIHSKNKKLSKNIAGPQVVFACVFNGGRWQPIWYGRVTNNVAKFKNMSKGVVYLPFHYNNGILTPAGNPFALGYKNKMELKPDSKQLHSITLPEQEKYLNYREGKKYRLFIWNNEWQLVGEQLALKNSTTMTFTNIPLNALLIFIPEYSQGKERPFMVLQNGQRIWW